MANNGGKFAWYELMSTDTAAAARFYEGVLGWSSADSGMPGANYTLFSAGPTMIAGLMQIPEEMKTHGTQPNWTGYIGVDNVDAYVGRVGAGGGRLQRPPEDIPGVGRFAVVADPQGAVFVLFQPSSDEAPPKLDPMTPGNVGWHELMTADRDKAFEFYSNLFGWSKVAAHDMGPMGIYQTFSDSAGQEVGGMMTKPPDFPMSCWAYYFSVASVDAAVARIKSGKGEIMMGPMEVPGGSWVANCVDPQGAHFAIVGPK